LNPWSLDEEDEDGGMKAWKKRKRLERNEREVSILGEETMGKI